MEKELVCDLFEEAAPENESLARLVDDARWQELIAKFEKAMSAAPSPDQWKDFSDEEGVVELTRYEEPSAGAAVNPADPLLALVQELIEG
jgi:hypothetical protein